MNPLQQPRRSEEPKTRTEPAENDPEQENTEEGWVVTQIQESFESRA